MKKKVSAKLLAALLATSTILSGCGAQETISMGTGGKPSGIHMSEGAKYQYQSVEPSDIIVEYSGLKPDCSLDKVDGTYLLDSSVYEGDTFGIYLDGEYFGTTIEEYVPYSDIQWAMVDNTEFWSVYGSRATSDMIDTSMIEGKVIYSDGSEMIIEPERVWGTLGGGEVDYKLSVVYRGKVYEVSSPCPWLDWDMSGSDGEVADVSGSVVLNPSTSGFVSDSETPVSTESTGEGFATLDEFYASDLYKKLDAFFETVTTETNEDFKQRYGVEYQDLWALLPVFLDEQGKLSELSKLESVDPLKDTFPLGNFIIVYDEIMTPYGKDLTSLAAEHDAVVSELRSEFEQWRSENVVYYIGDIFEVAEVPLEEIKDGVYEGDRGLLNCVKITRVAPECNLDLQGYTLKDIGCGSYNAGTEVYYDLTFPKEASSVILPHIPEEGTILSYDYYDGLNIAVCICYDEFFDDNLIYDPWLGEIVSEVAQ